VRLHHFDFITLQHCLCCLKKRHSWDGLYDNGGNGTYQVTLGKTGSPVVVASGDQGGSLNGAGVYNGTIDPGELDVWKFTACAGAIIVIQMDETVSGSSLFPYLRLYGPDGTLLNAVSGQATALISRTAPASGTFTVVAANDDVQDNGGNGAYHLTVNGLSDGFKTCMAVISGTNANLGGIGGPPGTNAILYTATNVTTAAALWTPILTNQFDQFGVLEYTNLFNLAERQRFFRLAHP
jgi:hypothetical protein